MARTSWLDEKSDHPLIHERVQQLDAFTATLADGVVTAQELSDQERRLTAAMKSVESELSDAVHAKMTTVLVEMTAYNVMRLLRELQAEHARVTFNG